MTRLSFPMLCFCARLHSLAIRPLFFLVLLFSLFCFFTSKALLLKERAGSPRSTEQRLGIIGNTKVETI